MTESPQTLTAIGHLASISIDCADPAALADFYSALLGMPEVFRTPDGHVISLSDGRIYVSLMYVENHVAPTWPEPGQLQQMHLDLAVTDLDPAVAAAEAIGARQAAHQPMPQKWRVLVDPAGHPFCLTTVTG